MGESINLFKAATNSSSTPGGEVPHSSGGENVEKSKVESDGATEILHIQLLATLIENLFLMFSLRYGQDDKYRENSSSTPGGEVSRSDGGEEHGNAKASNALFVKNRPPYFFIIADFIIFSTDNTLLYYKPLVGDYVAKIVIPTERSDEGSLKLHERDFSSLQSSK